MSIKDNLRLVERVLRMVRYVLFLIPVNLIVSCLPRDKNLWVFTSRPTQYNDNSRLFFEWVNQNHPEIKAVWLSNSEEVVRRIRDEKRKAFRKHSLGSYLMSVRAGKVFTSYYGLGDSFPRLLMGGTEWYKLSHGMFLKQNDSMIKWRRKAATASKAKKPFADALLKLFSLDDYYAQKTHRTIVNSYFFVSFAKVVFRVSEKDVLKTGSPRCDALFYRRPEPLLENLRAKFPGCKIILYMPTFRSAHDPGGVFDPFTEKYGFNEAELEEALERNNCVLLYKAHFIVFSKEDKPRDARSRFREISDDDYDELYNFVGQVDVLVTDYSSIYFDFLAIKKPVILCPFGYEDYIKYSNPFYYDYFENIEGVKAMNWREFIKILDEKSYYPVSEETRIKFAEYLDGNCCQKVFDAVMEIDGKK